MKRGTSVIVCWLAIMLTFVSCSSFGNRHNINITLSETDQDYKIQAHYPQAETGKVEDYLTHKLGSESDVSFANTHIDAQLTLNDGTKFYMKHEPGRLLIRFDKDRNSVEAYHNIKAIGEGLKNVLK